MVDMGSGVANAHHLFSDTFTLYIQAGKFNYFSPENSLTKQVLIGQTWGIDIPVGRCGPNPPISVP